ncbi:hypothetical protein ABIE56_003358 [Luteibacter sp. 621]
MGGVKPQKKARLRGPCRSALARDGGRGWRLFRSVGFSRASTLLHVSREAAYLAEASWASVVMRILISSDTFGT